MSVFILSLINTYTGSFEIEAVFENYQSAKHFTVQNGIDEGWFIIEEYLVSSV